jgi:hypothetical protein
MRQAILFAASGMALASPALAADLPATRYREARPVVVTRAAPVVTRAVVVRRPVVPVYVYGPPSVYAYVYGPVARGVRTFSPSWTGWGHGHRGHLRVRG